MFKKEKDIKLLTNPNESLDSEKMDNEIKGIKDEISKVESEEKQEESKTDDTNKTVEPIISTQTEKCNVRIVEKHGIRLYFKGYGLFIPNDKIKNNVQLKVNDDVNVSYQSNIGKADFQIISIDKI